MALVGKPALVTDIGEIIPRTQSRFGVFHARDAEKASWRQAGVLFKGADCGLMSLCAVKIAGQGRQGKAER